MTSRSIFSPNINFRIVDRLGSNSNSTSHLTLNRLLQSNSTSNNNQNRDLSPRAVEALQDLRQSGSFCDVVIKASLDGEELLAHRAILGAAIPFFKEMLNDIVDEAKKSNILHIEIDDIEGATLKIVIDFVYTGCFQPNEVARACCCFAWAHKFGMPDLAEVAGRFLRSNLNVSNCLNVYACVATFQQPENQLRKSVQLFMLRRFDRIFARNLNELMGLINEDELALLLDDDWLNANEEQVFETIVGWLSSNNNGGNQSKQASKLWQCLRYGLLPVGFFFEQVHNHPFVPQSIAKDGATFFGRFVPAINRRPMSTGPKNFNHQIRFDEKFCKPRLPGSFLFVFGGWSNGACTSKCEVYDSGVDQWRRIFSIDNGPRAYQQTLLLNGLIYLIGGFDAVDHYSGCRSFDPCSGQWREIAPMNYRRCYVSGCVLDGKIYAIGGCDKTVRLDHGEVYDPTKNQWTMLAGRLSAKRSDANCAVVSINGQLAIVICGGFDGMNCLTSVEMLTFHHIGNNWKRQLEPDATWTFLPSMTIRRSGVSVCTLNGLLYALGGYDGVERLNSVECFDFTREQWRLVEPMLQPRSNFAATVLNGKIFVCGGYDGEATINDCECYDPVTNTWSRIGKMNDDRSALSCCPVLGDSDNDDMTVNDGKTQLAKYAYPRNQLSFVAEGRLINDAAIAQNDNVG